MVSKMLRMSEEELDTALRKMKTFTKDKMHVLSITAVPERQSKYRSRKTGGYASVKESKRAAELKLMEKDGLISNLREQVPYELIPKQDGERACRYFADFVYDDPLHHVVEDCKGMRTEVYRIKRKLMLKVHGIKIRET